MIAASTSVGIRLGFAGKFDVTGFVSSNCQVPSELNNTAFPSLVVASIWIMGGFAGVFTSGFRCANVKVVIIKIKIGIVFFIVLLFTVS